MLSEYGFQEVSEGMQLSTNAIFQKFNLILNNSNYSVILRECVLMYASVLMYIKHFQDLLKDNHNTIYFWCYLFKNLDIFVAKYVKFIVTLWHNEGHICIIIKYLGWL